MREQRLRGLSAAAVALIMIATAVAATWLIVTSGVLAPAAGVSDRPVNVAVAGRQPVVQTEEAVPVNGAFQLSQPRDPFQPLITEESILGGIPGVGGAPGSGTDNGGFQPGNSISLESIDDVDGELVATIVVNGVTYKVKEGETFAGSFKVVALTEESALIQFGDIVFELKVGQQILK